MKFPVEYQLDALKEQLKDVGFWSYRFGEARAVWSTSQWSIFGRSRDQPTFGHDKFLERIHPADRHRFVQFMEWTGADDGPRSLVFRVDVPGRGERWIAAHGEPMKDEHGDTIGMQGLNKDVTADLARWHESAASRVVLESMPSGVSLVSGDGEIVYVNDTLCRTLGRESSQLIGQRPPYDFWAPEDAAASTSQVSALLCGNMPAESVRRTVILPSGERRHLELSFASLRHDGGSGFVANVVDITDRIILEDRLAASDARFRAAFKASSVGMAISSRDLRILEANEKLAQILGAPMRNLIGLDWRQLSDPADTPVLERLVQEIETGARDHYSRIKQLVCPSGRIITVEIFVAAIRGSSDRPTTFVSQIVDISERLKTECRLREMVQRFEQVTETIDDVFWISDLRQKGIYVSPGVEKIWGRKSEEFLAGRANLFESIHSEDRTVIATVVESQKEGKPFSHEFRIVRPDGGVRWILDKGFPVVDPDRVIRTYVGVARDITTEKTLRESVGQAQRLEAVGQLTGELAHDFNNLLSIVTMNAIQALKRCGGDRKLCRQLDTIIAAATRGGQVTKSLLAVSRRQYLKPRLCSLDVIINSVRGLIETSAGPRTELRIDVSDGRAHVEVDPAAFSNAVLNLVINARDAMPGGGILTLTLTVEQLSGADAALAAAGLPGGRYVVVEVSDTGIGMSQEILARIWDPFFTTKEAGHGSGLGLPAVYGFARQSRGTAVATSEPGVGTRVRIILPQVDAPAPQPMSTPAYVRKGWGRILLVDDEPDLLDVMAETLNELGYTVSTAGSGEEALRVLSSQGFELMLSDVAMRRMSGIELARRAQASWPELKILLMSGFAAGAMPSDLPWPILEKPVGNDDLAAALSASLIRSS